MEKNKINHPSYGMIGFSRIRGGNPYLFGSAVKHDEKIECTIRRADVSRSLSKDWFYGKDAIVTVEMSYAQFAEAISSMNIGFGVPCTITYTEKEGMIPNCNYESKRETYRKEFENTVHKASADTDKLISDLQNIFTSKKTLSKADKENILKMLYQVKMNIDENASFVFDQFNEHMDQAVNEAKSEIEAFAQAKMNSIALAALAEKGVDEITAADSDQKKLL